MIPIRTLQRRNGSVSESSCSMLDWVDDDGYSVLPLSPPPLTRAEYESLLVSAVAFRGQTGHDALRNMWTCAPTVPLDFIHANMKFEERSVRVGNFHRHFRSSRLDSKWELNIEGRTGDGDVVSLKSRNEQRWVRRIGSVTRGSLVVLVWVCEQRVHWFQSLFSAASYELEW